MSDCFFNFAEQLSLVSFDLLLFIFLNHLLFLECFGIALLLLVLIDIKPMLTVVAMFTDELLLVNEHMMFAKNVNECEERGLPSIRERSDVCYCLLRVLEVMLDSIYLVARLDASE